MNPDRLEPTAGESLDGYLAFRAADMGLPNIGEIAGLVGIACPAQSRISRSPEPLDDVAELLETPLATLESLALPPAVEPGRRMLAGASVSIRHLERVRRVFAPGALAQSPRHRALWDLRPFPFDEGTSEYLRHRCPDPMCRRSQGWNHTRGIDACDECGEPLAGEVGARVPDAQLPDLLLGLGLVHPDARRRSTSVASLPCGLRGLDRGVLLDLLVALAGTVDPRVVLHQHPWTLRRDAAPAAVCAAMAGAWELLAGWPEAFERRSLGLALDTPRGRGDGNGGATVRFLGLDDRKLVPSALADLVGAERRRLEVAGETRGIRSVEATAFRGMRGMDLARARRNGSVPVIPTVVRGQFIPMLDRAAVAGMADRFSATTSLLRAGAALGCGRLGVEQLHAMGLLGDEEAEKPITGHEARVSTGGLGRLAERLAEASVPIGTGWIPLEWVLRCCGGAPKPIGPLVAGLLGPTMPFGLEPGGDPVLKRIVLAPSTADAIRRLTFDRIVHRDRLLVPTVSKIEAGWELNLKSKHWVAQLARWPTDGALPVVPVEWLIDVQRTRISAAELSRILGRHGNSVRWWLEERQIRPVDLHLYDRAEVELRLERDRRPSAASRTA